VNYRINWGDGHIEVGRITKSDKGWLTLEHRYDRGGSDEERTIVLTVFDGVSSSQVKATETISALPVAALPALVAPTAKTVAQDPDATPATSETPESAGLGVLLLTPDMAVDAPAPQRRIVATPSRPHLNMDRRAVTVPDMPARPIAMAAGGAEAVSPKDWARSDIQLSDLDTFEAQPEPRSLPILWSDGADLRVTLDTGAQAAKPELQNEFAAAGVIFLASQAPTIRKDVAMPKGWTARAAQASLPKGWAQSRAEHARRTN
jgi:hypothetical protein